MKILRPFDSLKFVRVMFVAVACIFAISTVYSATLPAGYTELEYIESTGTQYIDTGYKPNTNTELTGKIWAKTESKYIYGTGSSPAAFTAYVRGNWRFADKSFSTSSVFSLNTDYTFKHNKEGVWLNDTKVGGFSSPANFTTDYNLYLFAANAGTSIKYGTGIRIYNLQIKDNGVLVRDFVPARRNSDGMIGMYDVVNWIFYPNKGTTAFSVGGDVVSPIKIATTKYNEQQFAPVETRLDAARTAINDLITQMQTNAVNVSKLAVEKQTRPNATCPAGKNCLLVTDPTGAENWYVIAGADDVETAPTIPDYFSFTTTALNAGDSVSFNLNPSGTFTVDWGDGSTPQVIERTKPFEADTIDADYEDPRYTHTYANAGPKTVKITGRATGYSMFLDGVFNFENTSQIASIDGCLGAIFPTLGNGAGQQPQFKDTFSDVPITSIPENLFRGITGAADNMFFSTFAGTQITSIPAGLFSGITGAADNMFFYTFVNTPITSIPENLFRGVTGAADYMFEGTFAACTNLTGYIPESTFAGLIQNNSPDVSDFMTDIFQDSTGMATTCPQNTTEVSTPYKSKYWETGNGNAVMCRPN